MRGSFVRSYVHVGAQSVDLNYQVTFEYLFPSAFPLTQTRDEVCANTDTGRPVIPADAVERAEMFLHCCQLTTRTARFGRQPQLRREARLRNLFRNTFALRSAVAIYRAAPPSSDVEKSAAQRCHAELKSLLDSFPQWSEGEIVASVWPRERKIGAGHIVPPDKKKAYATGLRRVRAAMLRWRELRRRVTGYAFTSREELEAYKVCDREVQEAVTEWSKSWTPKCDPLDSYRFGQGSPHT